MGVTFTAKVLLDIKEHLTGVPASWLAPKNGKPPQLPEPKDPWGSKVNVMPHRDISFKLVEGDFQVWVCLLWGHLSIVRHSLQSGHAESMQPIAWNILRCASMKTKCLSVAMFTNPMCRPSMVYGAWLLGLEVRARAAFRTQ